MANADPVRAENVQVTRPKRKRDHISRPRRDPVRDDGNQQMTGAFAGNMRLITEPLIGDDAHAHGPLADRDPLWPYADPHTRRRRKRPLRRLVEAIAADVRGAKE